MRPVSERLNVIYIRYFEDFAVGKGTLQTITGTSQVLNGTLLMNPGNAEHCDLENDVDFQNIFLIASVTLPLSGSFALRFNIQNSSDFYRMVADMATSTMRMERVVAGVPTVIDGPHYVDMVSGVQYVLSISTFFDDVSNQTMIRYLHDSNVVGQVFDSAYDKGKFGFESQGAQSTIREIEMFLKPLETNRINPNFQVQ